MHCRLYIEEEINIGESIGLPSDQGHYLRTVMRLGPGSPVVLFNGFGGEYQGTIEILTKQESSIHVESFADISREMPVSVHIVQAACRNEKIETVLQKATELGAASFTIIRSERSSLKLDANKLGKRIERWQKIIIEAAEQSERTSVPKVQWLNKLSDVDAKGMAFTLHPETDTSWPEQRSNMASASNITLAIGPEGGWSPRDIEILASAGFQSLTFGPRVMRTETAAPALLAAIQSLLD
ncbi:16S rRNA (uracil1498-N3)-methyltransferase [Mariprofundus micogutta]|uniref:Ribosomal RNA small subunit methyltransferase E n=2 Tax=Mariprofundus micogutta TaxID=1921010 RepID=A0A1L8CPR2_9PROT|nr:16S rRNA (uracil1498-N3)-methyltransferase [Mariprofundus micogutta]